MQAIDLRNKFALLRHQVTLVFVFVLLGSSAQAQLFRWARQHNPNYDERKISYGFSIGLHTSSYQVKYSDQFVAKKFDTVTSVQPQFLPGFSLGFLVNYRLNEFFDLRLMPKAGFYSHYLTYYYTNRTTQSQRVETTMVEFPLLLKFKSMRRGNVRMYMVGGITPSIEASGKNDIGNSSGAIPILKRNITLDAGIGFDFYFPLFKFSPELRFSRGITNMLGDDASIYKDPLSRLNTNTIGVYLIFQ
ncbi:MAG: porin family protein [Cyclobacteriaceae bacterium]|jgi:Outer membrane protein beta-barrel domain